MSGAAAVTPRSAFPMGRILGGTLAVAVCLGSALVITSYMRAPAEHSVSYQEIKSRIDHCAETMGGFEVLGAESAFALQVIATNSTVASWYTIASHCPNIMAVQSTLRPDDLPYLSLSGGFPTHIVVRLGTHRKYFYLRIFDPSDFKRIDSVTLDTWSNCAVLTE